MAGSAVPKSSPMVTGRRRAHLGALLVLGLHAVGCVGPKPQPSRPRPARGAEPVRAVRLYPASGCPDAQCEQEDFTATVGAGRSSAGVEATRWGYPRPRDGRSHFRVEFDGGAAGLSSYAIRVRSPTTFGGFLVGCCCDEKMGAAPLCEADPKLRAGVIPAYEFDAESICELEGENRLDCSFGEDEVPTPTADGCEVIAVVERASGAVVGCMVVDWHPAEP